MTVNAAAPVGGLADKVINAENEYCPQKSFRNNIIGSLGDGQIFSTGYRNECCYLWTSFW